MAPDPGADGDTTTDKGFVVPFDDNFHHTQMIGEDSALIPWLGGAHTLPHAGAAGHA